MKTIYVVEDDENIGRIVTYFLKPYYNIVHCGSVMEAGRQLRAAIPDFIIMDLGLPDLSGFQFIKMLRQNEKYKHIPVMILTGQAPESAEKAFRESGAEHLMYKPFTKASLVEKLTKILPPDAAPAVTGPASALPASAPVIPAAPPPPPSS